MRTHTLFVVCLCLVAVCHFWPHTVLAQLQYPPTTKGNTVDNYHGTQVADPYRWLEDDRSAETAAWVTAQNKVTFGYLEQIPYRKPLAQRLEQLQNFNKFTAPFKKGGMYYSYGNSGLQNQFVLYRSNGFGNESAAQQGEVFLDPNTLSADGTTALSSITFSKDNRYCAYALSKAGSDWLTFQVMDVKTKQLTNDMLQWIKFNDAAWFKDGFYYARFDEPKGKSELSAQNEYQKVFYHKVGTEQSADKLIYEDKKNSKRYFDPLVTDDERYLLMTISQGAGDGNALYYSDLRKPNMPLQPIIDNLEARYSLIDNIGDKLLLLTDHQAPQFKIILVDPNNPKPQQWQTIVANNPKETIQSAKICNGKLLVTTMKDVANRLYTYDLTGKLLYEVPLPGVGTITGLNGEPNDPEIFLSFNSYTTPTRIYTYYSNTNELKQLAQAKVSFNPDDFETKQVFYTSKDGTKIPMFICAKKGIVLNGTNPCLLYAYGGFNVSLLPRFDPNIIALLENGGIYAVANLRGGGEYGEAWHKAGMLLNKQNVFDDFIAAGQYLIDQRYTSAQYLAINGGSNGGLLVAAVMLQRPELFKVAIPAVGVLDMLRYHKFTVGWGWVSEYGSADDVAHFKNLYGYSPLHNIKSGVNYPATLIMTADHDDRVVPAHSFKFAAALQEKYKGNTPMLIRIETAAGHGAGLPTSKRIQQTADMYSFMWYNMKVTPKL
jgi:prolyl oligopeptidase